MSSLSSNSLVRPNNNQNCIEVKGMGGSGKGVGDERNPNKRSTDQEEGAEDQQRGKRSRGDDGEAVPVESDREPEGAEHGPDDLEGADGDEGVRPRGPRGPAQPTEEERRVHRCTHIPYRS